VWGNPLPATSAVTLTPTLQQTDLTSEFALVAIKQGAIGLVFWIAAGGMLLITGWRARHIDRPLLTLSVAGVGMWMAMLSMALITSFAATFWLIAAAVASRQASLLVSGTDDQIRVLASRSRPWPRAA